MFLRREEALSAEVSSSPHREAGRLSSQRFSLSS